MPLKREDLRAQLKRGELSPVYVLFGEEAYLRDLAAKTIADRAFGEGDARDFNESCHSLTRPGELIDILTAARQLPMMSYRRVIHINNVRITQSGRGDTIKEEDDENALRSYLEAPAPDTMVIFVAEELNGVRRMGKLLRESTFCVEFDPLTDPELAKWAVEKLRELESEIEAAALDELIKRCGPDVRRVTNEAAKLAAAAYPQGIIGIDLVEELVPFTREQDNFEIGKHLVAGNRKAAFKVLRKVFDDGAEPVMIPGLLNFTIRRLLLAKALMKQGADRREVVNAVKLRYSDQEPFLAAARRADESGLIDALNRIAEADLAMKTSKGGGGEHGSRMLVEMLLGEIS